MKKLLIALLFVLPVSAFAANNNCYVFNNDKLVSRSPCTVRTGGGAGGYETSVIIKNKRYTISDTANYPDEHIESKETINNDPAVSYNRMDRTYRKIDASKLKTDKGLLYCSKSKSVDICYN